MSALAAFLLGFALFTIIFQTFMLIRDKGSVGLLAAGVAFLVASIGIYLYDRKATS